MSKKEKTVEEIKEEEKAWKQAEDEAILLEHKAKSKSTEDIDNGEPLVYCGPSIKNVARQYTVYDGGVPDMLEKFFTEYPIARALLVPMSEFPQLREKLGNKATPENVIFRKIMSDM